MALSTELFTIGVEEEFQIIDPATRELCPRSHHLLPLARGLMGAAQVQLEFRQSQIEVATPVCDSLAAVHTQIAQARRSLLAAAAQAGCQLVAAGTHPFSHWQAQPLTPKASYLQLAHHYQGLMQELVTFGCHIHIGIRDRDLAIQVMNRARGWLAPLLALSASSPFWLGHDTHYASYRTMLIRRLPMAGAPPSLTTYSEYQAVAQALLATRIIHQPTQICWDLRPSERFPTLEFRIPDMPLTVDETVMLAGLVRGLVRACYDQVLAAIPAPDWRPEVLAAAQWQAARWGLAAELFDLETQAAVPAPDVITKLLIFVRPALEAYGEWDRVQAIVQRVLRQGTSADRQRRVYQREGSLTAVVDYLVQETGRGLPTSAPLGLTCAVAHASAGPPTSACGPPAPGEESMAQLLNPH